jgi:uncharacterized protein YgiM (DUF1202 family)
MKKLIVFFLLIFGLMACVGTGLANEYNAVTAVIDGKTADRVHLREEPSEQSKSLGLYFTGTTLTCDLSWRGREWTRVIVGSEAGYIKNEFLRFGPDQDKVKPKQPAGTVKTPKGSGWVNMRTEPSLEAHVAKQLYHGGTVTVLGQTAANWYYVKAGDQYGYILSDYLSVGGSSSSTPNGPYGTAVVDGLNSDRVHLRESASTGSKSLGLYFTGTQVLCQSDPGKEWVKVKIGSQTGYMSSGYLYRGSNPGSVRSKQPAAVVKNAGNWVNLRKEPSLSAAVASRLYNGDKVTVLGQTASGWYYVRSGDQTGYIMGDFLTVGGAASPSTPPSQGSSGDAIRAYKSVLQNQTAFFSAEDDQNMYLDQLADAFAEESGAPMVFTKFAVVDLDHERIPEVILWETVAGVNDYGFEVLHYEDGVVYGHAFGYRSLMELKKDGTFSFSSGAGDNGFGTVKFLKDEVTIDELTYCQSNDDSNGISYFVNHLPAAKNEFDSAMNKQQGKQNAAWYGITDANVQAMLPDPR